MTNENTKLWVVGIGSSAGGLEALQAFVSHLPKNLNAAVIVAQHLAPHAKSMLVELLSRQSTLPVSVAIDGEKLKAGQIYIVPPNHDIDLCENSLYLHQAGQETRPKPSVDTFFQSLARTWGAHSVGIILSGTGTDGTQGIQAVQAAGGLTLAQDDHSARYDGMPKSAADSGGVKAILAPDQMAQDLPQLMIEHQRRREEMETGELTWISQILELLKERTGLNFTQYKIPTIRRRIERHMNHSRYERPEDYVTFLKSRPSELESLSQELFINVTSFFRDPEAFNALSPYLEKALEAKPQGLEFRVWVAGCATGEEAYSLAILINELVIKLGKMVKVRLFATDLDQDALSDARSGIYTAEELKGMDVPLLQKYFRPKGERFEVEKNLRESIVFARQDLGQSPPFVKMDFVACRNVMIYFGQPLQKRIFDLFHYALNTGGILFLGKSESVNESSNLFETLDRKAKIFRKLNVIPRPQLSSHYGQRSNFTSTSRAKETSVSPLAELAQKEIMEHYETSGVVIDDTLNLLHVVGNVSRFVKYPEGQATLNITQILPKGVGAELPIIVKKSLKTSQPQRSRSYPVPGEKHRQSFQLHVRPMGHTETKAASLFLVLFEMVKSRKVAPAASASSSSSPNSEMDQSGRIVELENELAETKDQLQSVIQELGISNEELQSLNEELNSTNEELQSTNEELETTNEELQSTNEELTTLNEEMGVKSSELRQINSNLENVQNSIGSPLLLVDNDMRLVRFNSSASKVFDVSPTDIGRDLTRVSAHCEIPHFHELLRKTLESGKTQEVQVERGETVYQLRFLPSLDENRRASGAILLFIDNSHLIRAEEKLRISEQRVRAIIDSSPSLISLKDTLGRYLVANLAFADFFGLPLDGIVGRTDRELFDADLAGQLRDADLDVLYRKEHIRHEEELRPGHHFTVGRFPLSHGKGGQPYAIGMVGVDVSERVHVENELSRSEMRYRSIVEDQAVLVCRFNPQIQILFVNNAFTTYFGGVTNAYDHKNFLDLLDHTERDRVAAEFARLGNQSPILHLEHKVVRFGNQVRWLRWILKAVLGPGGGIEEIQGVGIDVTEYRMEADRLQERETVFSHIFSFTSDYLTVFRVSNNNEFFVESFNPSAEQAMGYSFTHLVGRNLRTLVDSHKVEDYVKQFTNCLKTGKPQVVEEEMRTPGGTKFLLTTLVPIANPQGRVERIASMSRDVSSFKVIEDELRAEKERAEEASRTKSDFLASMSHELRTPLNVVLGMAQLLADSSLKDEDKKYVASIERSGKVLLTLIEDVLDLSKVEEGQLRLERVPFDLREVIADVEDSFYTHAKSKDLIFQSLVGPRVPHFLLGDGGRVRQILVNLVGNAMKFTDSGSITVHAEAEASDDKDLGQIFFRVTDTGIGIKEDQKDRLFQKFSQADSGLARRYGGTGLGLVICKRLVELMDGEIGFDSHFGEGSVFWFRIRLPIASNLKSKSSPSGKTAFHVDAQPLKILAVEDNPDTQVFVQLLLKSLGHEVKMAASGIEAIEQIKASAFDLVLMDIQMPEQDGYQTTRIIRQMNQNAKRIPIIALTANAMAGDQEKCIEAGMNDYLSKPLQKESLQKILRKWSQHVQQPH